MLEPRRLAARTIASRMSELFGTPLGDTIGFRVRFESRVTEATKIEVLTEGILTRMMQSDSTLEGVGLVIFDEFHERSIHADTALAFCREIQKILRPDLRILIMSATLDIPSLQEMLRAEVIQSEGRQFPVDLVYRGEQDLSLLPEIVSTAIAEAAKNYDGDILVFLPGQGEIRKCEEILQQKLGGFALHALYGQLPQNKQYAAIMPDKSGRRKVVLATAIAETSLTIEGIKVVVDSGYSRVSAFDPKSGLSGLSTIRVTKDTADQRAGRAGRLGPGTCIRLWSKATHHRLAEHRTPEILEADLMPLALDLANWGHLNPSTLDWVTPPLTAPYHKAIAMLEQLEAILNGEITAHGKQIQKLPCHPRIAHMLIMAEESGLLSLGADVAAIVEERDPLPREFGIDINLRLEELRKHRREQRKSRKFDRIEKIAQAYRQLFHQKAVNDPIDDYETGLLLAYAYPERIACARPGNNAQFQLANGKLAMAGHRDDLAHEPWLAIAHVDDREGTGKIFLASRLNPQDLAPWVISDEVIKWDTEDGGLIANQVMRIGSIILQTKPLPEPDEKHLLDAVSEAIKSEGAQLLDFNDSVINWQNRVLSLKKWLPQGQWPDVSTSTLLLTNKQWLTPYLGKIKTPSGLKKIDLIPILKGQFSYEQQKDLDTNAPESISVPSGSKIKLKYNSDGSSPILAVRLQELFGMKASPLVCGGTQQVLLHLLSPGFKPVQITSDLKNFWESTYFEVKKELKRRYPKHAWPEDPLESVPVKGPVKRKAKH